jgi:hypothetical protein
LERVYRLPSRGRFGVRRRQLAEHAGGGNDRKLTAPTASSSADAAQLSTLRPTLVVSNGTSDQAGARTYEFHVSDKIDFSATGATFAAYTVVAQKRSIEGAGGTTAFTPDVDLQPATRLYWRARVTQASTSSDWSTTRSFNTLITGYAYLRTNNRSYSDDVTGSWPGAVYRNLWIGNAPRPQSLGSALSAPQPY